mmetsp:Transcript_275/g.624  ORF Transcript_275/g.624 Transcript_275/m.624 type:complete len:102 (-) Transcript_275:30-335(-)|eukprot:CAMPEP_0180564128 /NCGR_PEP_ID=MMETSP1037_2-20121125/4846_1 /TAXON_ID=632150 /ORGANISM="Azadinium spinosum, Strain 3D9" /LENGTH=101 /DNA_ID=CAMNT_0022581009 /DNA_START=67 /DNA_END=372 /DNA_ORIENTATION=+
MSEKRQLHALSMIFCVIISIHGGVWAAVNIMLFFINLLTTMLVPPWFLFPLFGWGCGLMINVLVFVVILYAKGLEGDIPFFMSQVVRALRRMRDDVKSALQ